MPEGLYGYEPEPVKGENHEELFGEEEEEEERQDEEQKDEELKPVASTMIAEWGYRRSDESLIVVFVNGRENEYPCSPEEWEEAQKAGSPGKWLHETKL